MATVEPEELKKKTKMVAYDTLSQTVLARDDTEKPHLLPTAPAIVRPANTPPLVVADLRSRFDNDLFFSNRFELAH